jgi:hypothetical protein
VGVQATQQCAWISYWVPASDEITRPARIDGSRRKLGAAVIANLDEVAVFVEHSEHIPARTESTTRTVL